MAGPKQELILPIGVYARFYRKGLLDSQERPALFIDRDGVLIEEVGYISRREDVSFISGKIFSGKFTGFSPLTYETRPLQNFLNSSFLPDRKSLRSKKSYIFPVTGDNFSLILKRFKI